MPNKLFLGSYDAVTDSDGARSMLRAMQISHVVYCKPEQPVHKHADITYLHVPVKDKVAAAGCVMLAVRAPVLCIRTFNVSLLPYITPSPCPLPPCISAVAVSGRPAALVRGDLQVHLGRLRRPHQSYELC